MIEAIATILNPISSSATLQTEISATAEVNFTINHYSNMKWTDTFTHADDPLILVDGEPLQRYIAEIPADTPLDQMLIMLDNTPLDCTNPDAGERDVISWIDQIMTFRKRPQNFSLRIQYPVTL